MATMSELRDKFDKMNITQKKQFIVNLKKQVEASNNAGHKQFLNECIKKYNAEYQASSQQVPIARMIDDEPPPLPEGDSAKNSPTKKKMSGNSIVLWSGLGALAVMMIVFALSLLFGGDDAPNNRSTTNTPSRNSATTDGGISASTPPNTQANTEMPSSLPNETDDTPNTANQSTYIFDSGAIYVGNLVGGIPNGYGVCEYQNGIKYEGEWKNGEPNGHGTFIGSSGDKFEGAFRNGVMHGSLVLTEENGRTAYIFAVNGEPVYSSYNEPAPLRVGLVDANTEYGTTTNARGITYVGDLLNGMPNGYGSATFSSGDTYSGEWTDGQATGFGRVTYHTGNVYIGHVISAIHHGRGVEYVVTGERFEGSWENGTLNGAIVFYDSNGAVYDRVYQNGRLISNTPRTEAQPSTSASGQQPSTSGSSATNKARADELAITFAAVIFEEYTGRRATDVFLDDSDNYYRYRVKVWSGDEFYFVFFRFSQDLTTYEHSEYPVYRDNYQIDDKGLKPNDWVD